MSNRFDDGEEEFAVVCTASSLASVVWRDQKATGREPSGVLLRQDSGESVSTRVGRVIQRQPFSPKFNPPTPPTPLSPPHNAQNTSPRPTPFQSSTTTPSIVPSIRSHILSLAHDSLAAGHTGRERTIDLVRRTYNWPGFPGDVHL